MSNIQTFHTDRAPAPKSGFSQATISAGPLMFVSGQGPFLPDGTLLTDVSLEEEIRQAFQNVISIAEAAGGSVSTILKIDAFVRNMNEDFDVMKKVFIEMFPEPRPARTTVAVDLPRFRIEVAAIVAVPAPASVR